MITFPVSTILETAAKAEGTVGNINARKKNMSLLMRCMAVHTGKAIHQSCQIQDTLKIFHRYIAPVNP